MWLAGITFRLDLVACAMDVEGDEARKAEEEATVVKASVDELCTSFDSLVTHERGTYKAVFKKRLHITVPGQRGSDAKKFLIVNDFLFEPFCGCLNTNDQIVFSNLWPDESSFPYMSFGQLSITLSRFVPIIRTATTSGDGVKGHVSLGSSPSLLICSWAEGERTSVLQSLKVNSESRREAYSTGAFTSSIAYLHTFPVVKTMTVDASYTYTRNIPNVRLPNYYANVDRDANVIHWLPKSMNARLYSGLAFEGNRESFPFRPLLVLAMPQIAFPKNYDLEMEIHGSLMMETLLEVYFHTDMPYSDRDAGQPGVELDLWGSFNEVRKEAVSGNMHFNQ